MSTTSATVAGMTCAHCVAAVREEVGAIAGVESVDVDLASGAVTITSDGPVDTEALRRAVEEAGYDLVAVAPAGGTAS
jgi:copper chaperone